MFKVQQKQCNECLFSSNRIVSKDRSRQIIRDTVMNNSYFICHKASMQIDDVCCRGWYDRFKTQPIRMAKALKIVKFVEVL